MQTVYEVMIDENGIVHAENNVVLPKGKATLTFVDSPKLNVYQIKHDFSEIFGLFKSNKSVSLEEMEEAAKQGATERFNRAVK